MSEQHRSSGISTSNGLRESTDFITNVETIEQKMVMLSLFITEFGDLSLLMIQCSNFL